MLAQLGAAIRELLGSKKWLALIVAVIAGIAAKIGWSVDTNTIAMFVGLVATAILGQGIADNGKESKKVELAHARIVSGIGTPGDAKIVGLPMNDPRVNATPPSSPPAGFARLGLLLVVMLSCAIGLIVMAGGGGCTAAEIKQDAKDAGYDCTVGSLGQLAPIGETLAGQVIAGSLTLPAVETVAEAAGADIGGCLLAHVLDDIPKSHALEGAPDVMGTFKTKMHVAGVYKTAKGMR